MRRDLPALASAVQADAGARFRLVRSGLWAGLDLAWKESDDRMEARDDRVYWQKEKQAAHQKEDAGHEGATAACSTRAAE